MKCNFQNKLIWEQQTHALWWHITFPCRVFCSHDDVHFLLTTTSSRVSTPLCLICHVVFQIQEVTSGYRITLTYQLYADEPPKTMPKTSNFNLRRMLSP